MSKTKLKENSSLLLYKDCDVLKRDFFSLKTTRDVATLLEVSFDRLIYHLYKTPENQRYIEFLIPKKSGNPRKISAPSTALKIIQRKLSQVLYSVYEPKATVHGFLPCRSIVTNAQQHLRKRFVLNIDLKDFFKSIHFGRVRGIFIAPPYNRSSEVATILAKICCHSGSLPQGAPTSPVISNMICAKIDSQLRLLAKECKCNYTRYADDITFSTTLSNFPKEIAYTDTQEEEGKILLGKRLISIIQDNGFEINTNKIRLQHKSQHQEVTGLTVNQFPNVKRKYVRQISSMLNIWQKYGFDLAEKKFREKQCKELGISEEEVSPFLEVIRGKINFLGMVRGKDNKIYRTYKSWFYTLLKNLNT
ncbi:MAG: reverse transcriptase family protein [Thermosynechococcaceae cyanobacterium MS004]|nr:reverse transcriptase family protein [Thermosynechococcaceae cyanobacterium MS004]